MLTWMLNVHEILIEPMEDVHEEKSVEKSNGTSKRNESPGRISRWLPAATKLRRRDWPIKSSSLSSLFMEIVLRVIL